MPKIPYIPFIHTHTEIKQDITEVFESFYDSQNYILGNGVKKYEKENTEF